MATRAAVEAVSLGLAAGKIGVLIGPSGCGKTTLLRVIAGLEAQTSGRVIQNGRDVSHAPPAARDYGIVFQSYALFPNLTVFDNVAYGLVNRRMPARDIQARVAELLKLIGLPGAGPKYPNHLSGGEQQRVALARALATSPGLLLLDEPLSALDAIVRVRLRLDAACVTAVHHQDQLAKQQAGKAGHDQEGHEQRHERQRRGHQRRDQFGGGQVSGRDVRCAELAASARAHRVASAPASVAPMTAGSCAFTLGEHCSVQTSVYSSASKYIRS